VLDSAGHLAGAQAASASIYVSGSTVHDCLYALYIGLPGSVGTTMRVRNFNAESYAFAADFTFCHGLHLLLETVSKARTRLGRNTILRENRDNIAILSETSQKSKYNFYVFLISAKELRKVWHKCKE